jgi:hypothetical protein
MAIRLVNNVCILTVQLLAKFTFLEIIIITILLLNIMRVINSRRNGQGREQHEGKERCKRFWWGNLRQRDHLEDLGVDGRIILRWIFRKWDGGAWKVVICLRIWTVAGTCKRGNELEFS